MTQKFCVECPWFIKPEEAGIRDSSGKPGESNKNGRCGITQRIIQRMKECPLIMTLFNCECGGRPEMRKHQAGYRMRCRGCGISTKILPLPAYARRAWQTLVFQQLLEEK
jgi:hypothetical protein